MSTPGFRRLVVAWTFSNLGDSALYLTLAMWAKDLTGSNAAAGLVFLALGLPVFVSPLAGHVADRVSRRRLMVAVNLAAAVLVLSLLTVSSVGDVWLLYAVTFAYGCVGYTTGAAQSGLLRDMVADEDLASANGLLTTIDQGLRLLTPLIGAGLYALYGGWAVAVLTSMMLATAAVVLTTLRVSESEPTADADRDGFWTEITAGIRHIRRIPALAQLTVILGAAVGVTGFMNTTTFAAIDHGLGLGTEFFGVVASVQGAGAIVGGLTAAALIARIGERATVGAGLVLMAIGIASTASGTLVLFCIGIPIGGVGVPWAVIGYVTMRQRVTPARLQGRTSAAANMALTGPQMAATAVGSALIALVDYRVMILAAAGIVLACAAVIAATPARPSDRPQIGDGQIDVGHVLAQEGADV